MKVAYLMPVLSIAIFLHVAVSQARENSPSYTKISSQLASSNSCQHFDWVDQNARETEPGKGALILPVLINGTKANMQFDTGSPQTMLYGKALAKRKGWLTETNKKYFAGHVTLGKRELQNSRIFINQDMPADQLDGTLGLDIIKGNIAVIDSPARIFCLYSDKESPIKFKKMKGSAASIKSERFLLPVVVGDIHLSDMLLDTGTIGIGLDLAKTDWEKVTLLQSKHLARLKKTVPAWGKMLTIYGDYTKVSMRIGDIELPIQQAFIDETLPASDFRGVIGMNVFSNGILVLDLTSRQQLKYIEK